MDLIKGLADLLVDGQTDKARALADRLRDEATAYDVIYLCRAAELFALHGHYADDLLNKALWLAEIEYDGTEKRVERQLVQDLRKDILAYLVGNTGGLLGRLTWKAGLWASMNERVRSSALAEPSLAVFLCYSSADRDAVRPIYERLKEAGMDVWYDEARLLPGQDWKLEIEKAIQRAHAVVVFLSHSSVSKVGFVQKELREALAKADEQPDGRIFVIPARLEECEIPHRLAQWQWVNLFNQSGIQRLLFALRALSAQLGVSVKAE